MNSNFLDTLNMILAINVRYKITDELFYNVNGNVLMRIDVGNMTYFRWHLRFRNKIENSVKECKNKEK